MVVQLIIGLVYVISTNARLSTNNVYGLILFKNDYCSSVWHYGQFSSSVAEDSEAATCAQPTIQAA